MNTDFVRIEDVVITPAMVDRWLRIFGSDGDFKVDYVNVYDDPLYLLSLFVHSHTSYLHPHLTFGEMRDLIENDTFKEEELSEPDDFEPNDAYRRREKYEDYHKLLNFLEHFLVDHFSVITVDMLHRWMEESLIDRHYSKTQNVIAMINLTAIQRFIINHGGAQTIYQIEYSPDPIELDPIEDEWVNDWIDKDRDFLCQVYNEPIFTTIIRSRNYLIGMLRNNIQQHRYINRHRSLFYVE